MADDDKGSNRSSKDGGRVAASREQKGIMFTPVQGPPVNMVDHMSGKPPQQAPPANGGQQPSGSSEKE